MPQSKIQITVYHTVVQCVWENDSHRTGLIYSFFQWVYLTPTYSKEDIKQGKHI